MSLISFRIDPQNVADNMFDGGSAVMAPGLFGGIAINRVPEEATAFLDSVEALGLTHIRWPGGTLARTAIVRGNGSIQLSYDPDYPYAYGLDYPELLHPRALADANGVPTGRLSFSDILQEAVERQTTLSVIVPTERYANAPATAHTDMRGFLERLFVQDAWNGGVLPEGLVLDIGNENYDPESYARVSLQMLAAVRDFRASHPEESFGVALQTMQDDVESAIFVDALHDQGEEDGLLAEADIVRIHVLSHDLDMLRDFEHGSKARALEALMEAIRADRALMGRDPDDHVKVYFSSWTTATDDLEESATAGSPDATSMLSFFSGMAELGGDYAAGWGIGMGDTDHAAMMTWRDPLSGELHLSAHGEVLRQMAEVLPGMRMLDHAEMDAGRDVTVTYFPFIDEQKLVIFLAANDLPSTGAEVRLDLSTVRGFGGVQAEAIRPSVVPGGEATILVPPMRVGEDEILVHLQSDYEVVRIIVPLEGVMVDTIGGPAPPGEEEDDLMIGGARGESYHGRHGDDTLLGGRGGDHLFGGPGDDQIWGERGSDTLIGGAGDDILVGGRGDDVLSGGEGADLLVTETGRNLLTGGAGADHFVIDPRGVTILTDFDIGQGDRLDFGTGQADPRAVLSRMVTGDFNATGEDTDLILDHDGKGMTVLLGGAHITTGQLSATLGVDLTFPMPYPLAPEQALSEAAGGSGDDAPPRPLPAEEEDSVLSEEEPEEMAEDRAEAAEDEAGQGACFVATAAYGNRSHPDVVWLRGWRDRVLARSRPGRAFIRLYWWVGPVLARHVRAERCSGQACRVLIGGLIRALRACGGT